MIDKNNIKVEIETSLGKIVVDLYEKLAPITAANFLRYVDEKRLDGASFFRLLTPENQADKECKIHVIQGGLKDESASLLPPITHENTQMTGCTHKNGTLSMARKAVGTATGSFFICIGAQPELDFAGDRQADGQGFAAFGQVVEGMNIALNIWQCGGSDEVVNEEIQILSARRLSVEP